MALGEVQRSADFTLEPSAEKVKQNSDNWPLLLKGWDKLNVRTSHFVPIPAGCSPLKVRKRTLVRERDCPIGTLSF